MIGTVAVILAGGRSSRMNGQDKALIDMGGITLVELQYRRWYGVFDETAVSIGRPGRYPFLGSICTIADETESSGPFSGLLSAMRSIEAERFFIVAVDMPFSSPSLGRFIVNSLGKHDAEKHARVTRAVHERRLGIAPRNISEKSVQHQEIEPRSAQMLQNDVERRVIDMQDVINEIEERARRPDGGNGHREDDDAVHEAAQLETVLGKRISREGAHQYAAQRIRERVPDAVEEHHKDVRAVVAQLREGVAVIFPMQGGRELEGIAECKVDFVDRPVLQ